MCCGLITLTAYAVELQYILLHRKALVGLYQLFKLVQQFVLLLGNFVYGKTSPAVTANQHLPSATLVLFGQLIAGLAFAGIYPVDHPDLGQQLQGAVDGGQANTRVPVVHLQIHIVGAEVLSRLLKDLQDNLPRNGQTEPSPPEGASTVATPTSGAEAATTT